MGLTQADLASELELSRAAIAGYENSGKEPTFEVLIKIADYFGVTTDYLLGIKQKSAAVQKTDFLKAINKALGDSIYAAAEDGEPVLKDFAQLLHDAFSDAQKAGVEDEIAQLFAACAHLVREMADDVKWNVTWVPMDYSDYNLDDDAYYSPDITSFPRGTIIQYSLDTVRLMRANQFRGYVQRPVSRLSEAVDGFVQDTYTKLKKGKLPKKKGN